MTHHSTPTPFTIAIPDAALDDLVRRLRSTRWADDFDNQDWSYGVERDWLMRMADYWASDFDWRAQEAAMNRYPQFKVLINDVPVHFMHIRGKGPNPTPIVLTHGWPWTFLGLSARAGAADRSGCAWGRSGLLVRCGDPLPARIRLFCAATLRRVRRGKDRGNLGPADVPRARL